MRSALAGLCGLLAALLLPLALVSVWLHTVVADTADLREAAVTGVLAGLAVLVVAAVLGVGVRAVRRTAG